MLDLRLPIGYFFLLNAALLIIDGLMHRGTHLSELAAHRFNLDIVWGVVMAVFGLGMAVLAARARATASKGKSPDTAQTPPE